MSKLNKRRPKPLTEQQCQGIIIEAVKSLNLDRCPRCDRKPSTTLDARGRRICSNCWTPYSITANTFLKGTRNGIAKWLNALQWMEYKALMRLTQADLAKSIGVNIKTARKICKTLNDPNNGPLRHLLVKGLEDLIR